MARTTLPLLLLAACTNAGIKVETTDSASTGLEADADVDADADGDADADADTDSDPTSFEGSYRGSVSLTAVGPDGSVSEICAGDADAEVDGDNAVAGGGSCTPSAPPPGPNGGPGDLAFAFSGEIGAYGAFGGTIEMPGPEGAPLSYTLTGTFSSGGVGLFWNGSVPTPEGGELAFDGTIVLSGG